MKKIEEQTKVKMDNARIAWLIEQWYPSFWSYFKKSKPMPPRYVSKEEASKIMEGLNKKFK
jgi:hypothetical protein